MVDTNLLIGLSDAVRALTPDQVKLGVQRKKGQVTISDDLSAKIKKLRLFEDMAKELEASIKKELAQIALQYETNKLSGEDLTVSISIAPIYDIQDGYKRVWSKPRISYVPDVNRIEAFILTNNSLPEGVHMKQGEPSVKFFIKE